MRRRSVSLISVLTAASLQIGVMASPVSAQVSPFSCNSQDTVTLSGVGVRNINFKSETNCTVLVLMEIRTELRLITTNSLEAEGNEFFGTSTTGKSEGNFPFAIGTRHRLTSFTRLTTTTGQNFNVNDPRCTGSGTP
jgi:hypothetical protein